MCPTRLLLSLQLASDHTFTTLSHPPETITGVDVMGEKRTQLTHSVWPSGSAMTYLHSPRVFHRRMVLSREPETICRLSTEKATESTSLAWPTNRHVVWPVVRSHRRRVPSHEPLRQNWPSLLMTTSWM